ncbi:hypothetical protein [Metallosphaera hakonensis]|uniref:Uncharacterized protein n=2 Tax=Metallosphaera hakonensis TaxID=79601 RepID=A0A2U9IWU1_9CREN|nr:hypothetical protein [Metallosphaera hakonensis]AWS00505.1 hypothetical protein DFR87_02810 [Metallosphaera hakonensis JCM 8857 = DSM 7519]
MFPKDISLIGGLKDRLTEALLKYERASIILRVALSIVEDKGRSEVGDFDYRTLTSRLLEMGYDFEPKMILRALERDFGIIETSYKSSNQHWWRFIDLDAVKEALDQEEEDPEILLIKTQASSLGLTDIERRLESLIKRGIRSDVDRSILRKIAFEDLPLLLDVYKKSIQYEETKDVAMRIKKILTLASKVAKTENAKNNYQRFPEKEGERKDSHVNSLRLFHGEDIK